MLLEGRILGMRRARSETKMDATIISFFAVILLFYGSLRPRLERSLTLSGLGMTKV